MDEIFKKYESIDLYSLIKKQLQKLIRFEVRVFEKNEPGKPATLHWQDNLGKFNIHDLRPIAANLNKVVQEIDRWLAVNEPRQQRLFRLQVDAVFARYGIDLVAIETADHRNGWLRGSERTCLRLMMTMFLMIANSASRPQPKRLEMTLGHKPIGG